MRPIDDDLGPIVAAAAPSTYRTAGHEGNAHAPRSIPAMPNARRHRSDPLPRRHSPEQRTPAGLRAALQAEIGRRYPLATTPGVAVAAAEHARRQLSRCPLWTAPNRGRTAPPDTPAASKPRGRSQHLPDASRERARRARAGGCCTRPERRRAPVGRGDGSARRSRRVRPRPRPCRTGRHVPGRPGREHEHGHHQHARRWRPACGRPS